MFSFNVLTQTWAIASNEYDQEHITPFMNSNRFKTKNLFNNMDLSFLKWTVDEQRDLDEVRNTFLKLNEHHLVPWQDILRITKEIDESVHNKSIKEMKGRKWAPGNNLEEQRDHSAATCCIRREPKLLPEKWPTYFKNRRL